MQCDCQPSNTTTATKTPSAVSWWKEALVVDGDMFRGHDTLLCLLNPPLATFSLCLSNSPLAWRISTETALELGSSNQRPACHTEHYPRSGMETISCLFHRRATALPLPAKVTATNWLTEPAWQSTAHPAARLGPDSSLERTSRAQSRKENDSAHFPAPPSLYGALLWLRLCSPPPSLSGPHHVRCPLS